MNYKAPFEPDLILSSHGGGKYSSLPTKAGIELWNKHAGARPGGEKIWNKISQSERTLSLCIYSVIPACMAPQPHGCAFGTQLNFIRTRPGQAKDKIRLLIQKLEERLCDSK